MNVGDTITVPDLIAAWREDLRASGTDPDAAERSRVAQSSFGIDLSGTPPTLEHTWTPDWVADPAEFEADRLDHGDTVLHVARRWGALPADADPFEGMLEAPLVICALYTQHASEGRRADTDAMLAELVSTLWNIDPSSTAVITSAALYRTGPAARIVKSPPPDDEHIACPRCGWTGVVGDTCIEYSSDVVHRECPRCEKMLLIW